jgi:vacuolar protein sorting-associated protein 35
MSLPKNICWKVGHFGVFCRIYLIAATVITKVFPDEYHLHTLDQMLSAIARLNPHVDMKKIVIGLMDRLSSFAQRQADEDSTPAEKQKAEEDATIRLFEKIRLTKESKPESPKKVNGANSTVEGNGTKAEEQARESNGSLEEPTAPDIDGSTLASKTSKTSILADVKLYEIFYDQVVNLVKTRGLSIQDTMALLTSLVNLAL